MLTTQFCATINKGTEMQTKEELLDRMSKLIYRWSVISWNLSQGEHDLFYNPEKVRVQYKELYELEYNLVELNSELKLFK